MQPNEKTQQEQLQTILGLQALSSAGDKPKAIKHGIGHNVMKPSEFKVGVDEINYVWHRVLRKGWLYAMVGVPGTGKTAVSLSMAFAFIQGLEFQGHRTAKSRVLYLSGENPDDVRLRFEALLNGAGMKWEDIEDAIRFTRYPFAIDDPVQLEAFSDEVAAHGKFDVMFIDTGSAHTHADDENDNRAMHTLAIAMRLLMERVGNPATVALMHPAKAPEKNNLLPRGGSSFTGSIDGVIGLWREGGGNLVEMYPHKDKWRGIRFKTMFFENDVRKHPTIVDNFGYPATTCVSVEVDNPAAKEEAARQEVEAVMVDMEEDHLEKIVEIIRRKDEAKERVTTAEQGGNTTFHVLRREEDFPAGVDAQHLYALIQKLTRTNRLKRIEIKVDSKNRSYYTTNPALWGVTTKATPPTEEK